MKIIISRKGFDSQNGKVPSAIMPDRRLVPFPIPSSRDPTLYGDVSINGVDVADLINDLTHGTLTGADRCHLDPDIDAQSLPRQPGWRPSLGQIDAAQGHLHNQGVKVGDIFLFFGWFSPVHRVDGHWRYVPRSASLHVLYGWLRIGQIICLGKGDRPVPEEAFASHPHMHGRDRKSNTLYLADETIGIGDIDAPGAGIFPRLEDVLILTDQSQPNRSIWKPPVWMHPDKGTRVSYHENPSRWTLTETGCRLSSVAKGQEFVVQTDQQHIESWLNEIFK